MGVVSFLVDATDSGLATIAESQFAAVTESMGFTLILATTVALLLLFANMAFQFRPMDGVEIVPLVIKIGLIEAFALDWVNFNYVSSHLIAEIDRIAGVLITSVTGEEGEGAQYFAARFDQQLAVLGEYGNEITSHMGRVAGGMMSVFFTAVLALVGGLAAIVLILSKMMITLLIGIAPVMMILTLFNVSKDYFHRWLAALISWSLYPVVIAGTFSIIFGLSLRLQQAVGEADSIVQLGGAIPYLGIVFLSLAMILAIPMIVRSLTGDINAGWAAATVGSMAARLGQPSRATSPRSQPQGNEQRRVASRTEAPAGSPPLAAGTGTGAQMQRMKDRADRLRAGGKGAR